MINKYYKLNEKFKSIMFKCKLLIEAIQFQNLVKFSTNIKKNPPDRMQAWQIHAYGDLDQLKLSNIRTPVITKPNDVIVKIEAASVNPIDIAMIRGYGAKVLNIMRKVKDVNNNIEFPLTLGRDFSGIIASKGCAVDERLKLGDKVWGVVPVDQQGCHANYVAVDNNLVNVRPSNLTHIEAASILYAGLTAWSSLWITGGLCYSMSNIFHPKVLILGGSGGVGSLAIQLAKAWDLYVVTTCSTDAVETMKNLGADVVIDYTQNDAHSQVINEGTYKIILDCANQGPERIQSYGYPYNTYITLNSPLLKNVDNYGIIGGTLKNLTDIVKYNIPMKEKKGCVKYGFFAPSRTGINTLQSLVIKGQLIPIVNEVYSFDELPKAYEKASKGHLRGKLVIDMTG